jgi:hypothetical protein
MKEKYMGHPDYTSDYLPFAWDKPEVKFVYHSLKMKRRE